MHIESNTKELPAGNARELALHPNASPASARRWTPRLRRARYPARRRSSRAGERCVHTHVTGKLDMERPAPLAINSRSACIADQADHRGRAHDAVRRRLVPARRAGVEVDTEFANPKVIAYPQAHERVRGGLTLGGLEAARREVTIFDLLTMTSGVAANSRTPTVHWPTLRGAWEGTGFGPGDTRFNDPTNDYDDLVLSLARTPLHSHPGDTWQYGSDFDVLVAVPHAPHRQEPRCIVREKILGPLGMNDSAFYCREENLGRLVTDHQWDATASS